MKITTVKDLLEDELKDLYDAEKQLVRALPKMAKAASSQELRSAIEEHLEVTKGQVTRLEEVFETLESKPKSKTCEAMRGLVAEGQEAIDHQAADALHDVLLIGAAKRVEHYEMAAYQTAILLAEALPNEAASNMLRQTLEEEESADGKLESLCEELLGNLAGEVETETPRARTGKA